MEFIIESFLAVNLISIPRRYNQIIDALATKGTRLDLAHYKRCSYGVKVLCRPFILDTTNFWLVFDYDEHIMNLMIDEIVAHTFGIT